MIPRRCTTTGFATLLIVVLSCLTSCSAGTRVDGAYRVTDDFRVDVPPDWMLLRKPPRSEKIGRTLTIDGRAVTQVQLIGRLGAGKKLYDRAAFGKSLPRYSSSMPNEEVADFVAASLSGIGFSDPRVTRRLERTFGGRRGGEFDVEAQNDWGLEFRATSTFIQHNGRLYLALYMAPIEHYYALREEAARAVLDSIRVK